MEMGRNMHLPDGTILMHGKTPYDPVKAHEYYVRTRKLKGRKSASPSFSVSNPVSGKTYSLTGRQLAEQQAYAAKRVADIKGKLAMLSAALRKARAEARKKDGVDKKPTAAEKSKAARESKQYRQKHKQQLATKRKHAASKKPKTSHVDRLEAQVAEIRKRLTAAVAIQRALAGATKNR